MFASLNLKNSLNLTLKELNEAESRICFGISFQVLAPWYPKGFFTVFKSKPRNFEIINFSCVISRTLRPRSEFISEVLWAESIVHFVCSISYLSRLRTLSQSHSQPSLCLAHSIGLRALFCYLYTDSSFEFDRLPQLTLQYLRWLSIEVREIFASVQSLWMHYQHKFALFSIQARFVLSHPG